MAAGYNIYSRPTPTGADTLVQFVPAGTATWTLTGLAANSLQYVHVKALSAGGLEDAEDVRLTPVQIGADGLLVAPVPNQPAGVSAAAAAGGMVTVGFDYYSAAQAVAPGTFEVFAVALPGSIDYGTPQAMVMPRFKSDGPYAVNVGPFADGETVVCGVRAVSAAGAAEGNTDTVQAVADATAPDAPAGVTGIVS